MAARCPGCGSSLAANSRFCSLCGREAVPAASPIVPPVRTSPQGNVSGAHVAASPGGYAPPGNSDNAGKRKIAIFSALGGIAVAALLFFVLRAAGVLGAGGIQAPSAAILTAPKTQTAPAPILNAPEAPPPVSQVLSPPAKENIPMPEDIVAYLRWLKKFEAARRSLESRMTVTSAKILPMITVAQAEVVSKWGPDDTSGDARPSQSNATNAIRSELSGIAQEMNQAPAKFQGFPPPNPCAALALAYQNSLTIKVRQVVQMQDTFQQILSSFDGSNGGNTSGLNDIYSKLTAEYGSNGMSNEADAADTKANDELNALRSRYTSMPDDVRSFDIRAVNDQSLKKLIPSIPGLSQ